MTRPGISSALFMVAGSLGSSQVSAFSAISVPIDSGNDRVIYDPLGLYPTNSPDCARMQPFEEVYEPVKPIIDPLKIYPKGSVTDKDGADMSEALPFLPRPTALNGELTGDVGFDPLGFAGSEKNLMKMREAELKHSRLAMLAAAGRMISELVGTKIAFLLHHPSILGYGGRVPSLLNGGLTNVSPIFWGMALGIAGGIELYDKKLSELPATGYKGAPASSLEEDLTLTRHILMGRDLSDDRLPGDLGFDPLGLYTRGGESCEEWLQLAEIKHGRVAMLAVTIFAMQEWITKMGVADQVVAFLNPSSEILEYLDLQGYSNFQ